MNRKLELALRGAFLPPYYGNMSDKYLSVWIQLVEVAPGFQPVANLSAFKGNNIVFAMVSAACRNRRNSLLFISLCSRRFTPNMFIKNKYESCTVSINFISTNNNCGLDQWYSTGGTRRHLRGYVKFKISIYILFHE
jgi:hypothetical protein